MNNNISEFEKYGYVLIKNLIDKNDLIQIKNIIVSHNPDISMIKNNNGYLAPEFEKLSYSTYVKLKDYFNKIDKKEESESESEQNKLNHFQYSKTNEFFEKNINKKFDNEKWNAKK